MLYIVFFTKVKNTVWSRLNEVHVNVDYAELQDQFAMLNNGTLGTQSQRASAAGSSSSGALLRRAPVVTLLAMQRSNNVGVLLANLKMPPAQVCVSKPLNKSNNSEMPCTVKCHVLLNLIC